MRIMDMTTPAASPTPAMPYRVEMLRYGIGEGIERATKVFPHSGGDLLLPDEIAVWEYVLWLEAEVERLTRARTGPARRSHGAG